MVPSEKLRKIISEKYNIDLEQYSWTEEFKNYIFDIKLLEGYETNASTLGEIYERGFNIGRCELTARYITNNIPDSYLHYGIAEIIKGTRNSKDGSHAWTVFGDYIIDPTLMIYIPIEEAIKLGYVTKTIVSSESVSYFSEYCLYDHEFSAAKRDPDYEEGLYKCGRK